MYVFVAYFMVLKDKRNHCFLVFTLKNLRLDFERVKYDVRCSLKPFKDMNGCFDPSSTTLTKRSPTVHVYYALLVIENVNP